MKKLAAFLLALVILSVPVCPRASAAYAPDFELKSKSVILLNTDTDTIVFQQNQDEKVPPASLTKIVTAICVLEKCNDLDGTVITAPNYVFNELAGTGSSTAGVVPGEELSVRNLLYCMLLQSANEAANILADYIGDGDMKKGVDIMNRRAKELGAVNTNFMNAHGLHDEGQYTTPNDILKITRHALTIPVFSEIVKAVRYDLPATNKNAKKILVSTNWVQDVVLGGSKYYYQYCKGVMTGRTDEAGYCFVSTADRGGYHYLAICMGAPYRDPQGKAYDNGAFLDAVGLYKWAFGTFSTKPVIDSEEPVCEVKISMTWNNDTLQLVPRESITALVPNEVDKTSVLVKAINLPKEIKAPVKKGDVICKASVMLMGEEIAQIDLVASESAERSTMLYVLSVLNGIVSSGWLWFIAAIVLLVVLIIAYIIFAIIHNRKRLGVKKIRKFRRM